MSTRAQRRANKRNAKHSTGPKTEQGKQRCAQNAIKHGFRSKHPVIPGEDPVEYQHKFDQLRNDLRPLNSLEDDLVEQIADTSWRLKRLSRIEAAIERDHIEEAGDKEQNTGKDNEQIVGYAFTTHGHLDYLARLARYEAQLSRRYHRAIKELTDLRKTYEKTSFRTRPMEERDREEQHWRETHPPPDPPPAQKGGPTDTTSNNESSQASGQSQTHATDLDAMTWDEIGNLHPDEALKVIDKNLQSVRPTPGPQGPQEERK